MRLYWELARRGYRRYAAYPAATWAGVFTNAMFGFLRGYILLTLFDHRDSIGGYDARATITYVWLTQALIVSVGLWGWNELAERIKRGDIAIDMARPVHPLVAGLPFDLGRAFYHMVFRGLPQMALGALVFTLTAPSSVLVWLAFVVSVTLAVVVSYAFRFLYNLVPFWIGDYRGAIVMATLVMTLFSGFTVPLAFFPEWLRTVAYATPFPSMFQVPVDMFVGRTTGVELLGALAMQCGWVLGLLALAWAVYGAGTRRLAVQGG